MVKYKAITNDWNYDANCTLTSFPVWDFKLFVFVAQSVHPQKYLCILYRVCTHIYIYIYIHTHTHTHTHTHRVLKVALPRAYSSCETFLYLIQNISTIQYKVIKEGNRNCSKWCPACSMYILHLLIITDKYFGKATFRTPGIYI
jgi:hypothetical protein